MAKGGNEFIDPDLALAYESPPIESSYDERDVALYALGVGAAKDPLDDGDLQTVYELHPDGMKVLPTFGVVPALNTMMKMAREGKQVPGLRYGFERVLHGEQYTELKYPLPARAKLTHKTKIKSIFDKGKNALVVTATTSYDEDGNDLIYNELTTFVRGAGGWGGERGPSAEINVPPNRAPDAVVTEKIPENQALLYRLSGDFNPLHADPAFAKTFGFRRPILHGLCTFGIAARHVIKAFCKGDPRYFKSIKVRFADTVVPGDTIRTEMWKEGTKVLFRCKVEGREKDAISNAAIELYEEIPKKPEKQVAGSAGDARPVHDVFAAIRAHVERHPELVNKVQTVYQWKLTNPESFWTLDLKNGNGKVEDGKASKADTTLELSQADFVDITRGNADPQKLYFDGKLKISGNVMASQKLDFLKSIGSASPAATSRRLEDVLATVKDRLSKDPGLAKDIGGTLQVRVSDRTFYISPVGFGEGTSATRDATLTFADESAFLELAHDASKEQELYMRGQMRIDGDVRLAKKITFLNRLV